jgi:hypothetical protein
MRRPILNTRSPGQAAYEPFIIGTTLIAAEMTGRVCLGLELNGVAVEAGSGPTGRRRCSKGWEETLPVRPVMRELIRRVAASPRDGPRVDKRAAELLLWALGSLL